MTFVTYLQDFLLITLINSFYLEVTCQKILDANAMSRFGRNLGVLWCIALIVLLELQFSDSEEIVKESFEWKVI